MVNHLLNNSRYNFHQWKKIEFAFEVLNKVGVQFNQATIILHVRVL